jgi:HlyD family secretion protein
MKRIPFSLWALLFSLIAAFPQVALVSCSAKGTGGSAEASGSATSTRGSWGGASGSGQGGQAGGSSHSSTQVQAAVVSLADLTATHSSSGTVSPTRQSDVATQVSGVASKVRKRVGDWVSEGETVVQIDDSQLVIAVQNAQATLDNANINLSMGKDTSSQAEPKLKLQLDSAKSSLDAAQRNLKSVQALFDVGGATAAQLDTAKSSYQTAQANLAAAQTALDQNGKSDDQSNAQLKNAVVTAQNALRVAQLNLRNAQVKAPFAGQISVMKASEGSYLTQNSTAFTIVSREKQVGFNVTPHDAPLLKVGSKLSFSLNGKDYSLTLAQAPSAPVSGVVPLVANLPTGTDFPYGSIGSVSYETVLANGAIVAVNSLQTNEDKNFVYLVKDGKIATEYVTVLAQTGDKAAVSGLSKGDVVVLNPPPGLIVGLSVQTVMDGDESASPSATSTAAAGGKAGASGSSWAVGKKGSSAKASAQTQGGDFGPPPGGD